MSRSLDSTTVDLFSRRMSSVKLHFAPQHIFQQNLVASLENKTYKPELSEVHEWNFIVEWNTSAYALLTDANSEQCMTMRSPFVGDVMVMQDETGVKTYWVLAPRGGFWLLQDSDLLARLAVDQDDEGLIYSCEAA